MKGICHFVHGYSNLLASHLLVSHLLLPQIALKLVGKDGFCVTEVGVVSSAEQFTLRIVFTLCLTFPSALLIFTLILLTFSCSPFTVSVGWFRSRHWYGEVHEHQMPGLRADPRLRCHRCHCQVDPVCWI